jgi:hypothetical protein
MRIGGISAIFFLNNYEIVSEIEVELKVELRYAVRAKVPSWDLVGPLGRSVNGNRHLSSTNITFSQI